MASTTDSCLCKRSYPPIPRRHQPSISWNFVVSAWRRDHVGRNPLPGSIAAAPPSACHHCDQEISGFSGGDVDLCLASRQLQDFRSRCATSNDLALRPKRLTTPASHQSAEIYSPLPQFCSALGCRFVTRNSAGDCPNLQVLVSLTARQR